MKDFHWYKNRLQAMSPAEIVWRISNRIQNQYEKKKYYSLHSPVIEIPLSVDLKSLRIDISKLTINWSNSNWSEFTGLDLFSVFDYEKYKKQWNAGFQTENQWPEEPYSPTIKISQRVDIGDIRTNWELNRHFQFAALAKSYYCTGKTEFLDEFQNLFSDWNQHNLFLHGAEWTSAMEIAIRVNSWVYAFAFLKKANCEESLLIQIEHGILVMTDYIIKHRARYSSANNHLIIEMYAVALVGILTGYKPWQDESLKILTEELPRQNYSDGVNKEMSLHYQSFVMEAYGLLWLLMVKNHIEIPAVWKSYLIAMTEFVADSTDDFGRTMEFGDSDEGKILDLNGIVGNHYQYVLSLMGCLLDKRYTDTEWHENLEWIVPTAFKTEREKYNPGLVCSRKEGGYTFLRSKDRRVLIGIDHADFGYGSIAAHGHADALSFQMFIDGQPVFVDSGTYNYHVTPEDRNYFRSTAAHNTVMIDGQEQSEMLGPFIWGKKACAHLLDITEDHGLVSTSMKCQEAAGTHIRRVVFNQKDQLEIHDDIKMHRGFLKFIVSPQADVATSGDKTIIGIGGFSITISSDRGQWERKSSHYSDKYNIQYEADSIGLHFKGVTTTKVRWEG